MAEVKFKRETADAMQNLPIDDGSFIVEYETPKAYIDVGNQRIQFAGATPVNTQYAENDNETYSTNYINKLNGELLWTNPNPSSTMGSTDITVQDMSDYDMIEIFYYDYVGTQAMCSARAKVGELINLMTIFQAGNGGYLGNRVVTYINSTTLRFNDPVSIIINDVMHRQAVVDWCIPVYIIGYKKGLFDNV